MFQYVFHHFYVCHAGNVSNILALAHHSAYLGAADIHQRGIDDGEAVRGNMHRRRSMKVAAGTRIDGDAVVSQYLLRLCPFVKACPVVAADEQRKLVVGIVVAQMAQRLVGI